MLTVPAVFEALPYFKAILRSPVAVPTARTAGAAIVNAKLDLAERTLSLDNRRDGTLGLGPNRVPHALSAHRLA